MAPDPWRYCLPCGHHARVTYHTNPPERRYQCDNERCGKYFPEGSVIDKKEASPGDVPI